MTAIDHPTSEDLSRQSEMMERHGIALVRADQYHVDGYRYTNLADAIAQAGRRTSTSGRAG